MQLSDQDTKLLSDNFSTTNPELLEGLSKTLPKYYNDAIIEFSYDVTPPKNTDLDYIWCAHDGKPTHWKGYVMVLPENNVRFLIGHNCGKEIYGVKFTGVERDHSELKKRQNILNRILKINRNLPLALQELDSFLNHPIFEQFKKLHEQFSANMDELRSELIKEANKNNGTLTIEKKIRDYAAEEFRLDKYREEDENSISDNKERHLTPIQKKIKLFNLKQNRDADNPIYQHVIEEVGRLNGIMILRVGVTPRKLINGANTKLYKIAGELKALKSDKYSTGQLRNILNSIKKEIKIIETQIDVLSAPMKFFSKRNLQIVTTWGNDKFNDVTYSAGEGFLAITINDKKEIIKLPQNYNVPDLSAVLSLKK